MTETHLTTQHLRELLFSVIGNTKVKNYFYAYNGIFKDNLMIGLYKDGKFYLRFSDLDIDTAINTHNLESLSDSNITHSEKYFLLPSPILNNLTQYSIWFTNSLAEVRLNKRNLYYTKKHQLRSLPNMTFRLEKYLNKINIYSIEQLIEKGEINAFVELVKMGMDASENTLLKLHGAITHQFIYTITDKTKSQLLSDANNALYAAGLRKRFKN
ncbi:TfoX/Sxy family DNA transformation protein [Frederiksenia canicola]